MDAPNATDILEKEGAAQASRSKVSDAWAPYESKLVRHQQFNTAVITESYITYFPADVPSRHP